MDFDAVMRVFGDLLRHLSAPLVSIPAFGKHSGAAFGLNSFGATSLRSPNVAVDHELSDYLCAPAVRNIRQDLVELLGLRTLGRIVDNSSVLVQAAEVKSPDNIHHHKGRF